MSCLVDIKHKIIRASIDVMLGWHKFCLMYALPRVPFVFQKVKINFCGILMSRDPRFLLLSLSLCSLFQCKAPSWWNNGMFQVWSSILNFSSCFRPCHWLNAVNWANYLCRLLYGSLLDGPLHILCILKKLERVTVIRGMVRLISFSREKFYLVFLENIIKENLCLTLLFVYRSQHWCHILGRRICRYELQKHI